jgi:hypothetical protein
MDPLEVHQADVPLRLPRGSGGPSTRGGACMPVSRRGIFRQATSSNSAAESGFRSAHPGSAVEAPIKKDVQMKRAVISMFVILLAAGAAGCHSSGGGGSSSSSAVKPLLAAFNATADMPDVAFLREQEVWSTLSYGVATDYRSVDADQYDLNFYARLPGDQTTTCAGDTNKNGSKDTNECTLVATKSVNVLDDHEYVMALLGRYGALDTHLYDDVPHVFSLTSNNGTGDTDTQVQIFNWSTQLGTVDVYIEPPGTNLSVTQVKATLAPGDEFNGMLQQGTYVITLTPVGDPNNPLYLSQDFGLAERTRVGFAVLDATNESTSSVKVSRFRDQGGDLPDRREQTLTRVAHAAPDIGNVDIYQQEDYSAPWLANFAVTQTSPYVALDPSNLSPFELDITPPGNVGVLLARSQLFITNGTRTTLFLVQKTNGALNTLEGVDTARRITPYAQIRLVNTVAANVDYYLIPHQNNVYTSTATETLIPGSIGASHQFDPGDYDLFLMRSGTTSIMYGPQVLTLAGGGIYTVVGVPTADISRADTLLLDDFQN